MSGTCARQARRAIDGALSRDRGRLHGLWSRWSAKPADDEARAAFAQALAHRWRSARRAPRALPQAPVDAALADRARSRTHRRADPRAPGGRDRRRNRLGQDHAAAEAVPGRRPRRGRHDRLHPAAPDRGARGGAARGRGAADAAGRRGRLPGALQRQRRRRHRDQVHDRRHPAGRDPVRPLAVAPTTRSSSTRRTSAASTSTSCSATSSSCCASAAT